MQDHLIDASGGLVYHWRALRYRRRVWQPFVAQVARWLADWQPPQRELVLVGPSAGYTLDRAFLERFTRVIVLEPDPLARSLLRRRFAGIPFEEGRVDCFAGLDGPRALSQAYPHAAILFSNSLGQQSERLGADWLTALPQALAAHSWATYHDVVAVERAPLRNAVREAVAGESFEMLLGAFWGGGQLEVCDHASFGVLPAQAHTVWALTPQWHHLIGWNSIIVVGSSMLMPGNSGISGRS